MASVTSRTFLAALALVLASMSACSRTRIDGELVYEFQWDPADGPDAELQPLTDGTPVADFVRSTGEDFCDPMEVTSARLTVEGDLTGFDSAAFVANMRLATASFWSAGEEPSIAVERTEPIIRDDPETHLELQGAQGTGPGVLRWTLSVGTWCGEVTK